ncbi:MAG: alpha/beta hydrolase [Simkaniaceae bacterium]|nr:alpha/beta hydrolase [Candidatus Sacchlamyda saccharinae]
MPHIKANDIHIYYESFGSGPPLVLISGFAQNHACWTKCIPQLAKHFQVIAFDNRGSGQTEAPDDSYSIEMFANDTAALLESLEIESAHFMGVSMGTLIIQNMCLAFPEKVKKAVLCAPFAQLPLITKHNIEIQLQILASNIPRQKLVELNMSWLLSNKFMSDPKNKERYLQDLLSDPYPSPMEGLLGQADALKSADFTKQLGKIPHHTLLLAADEDIDTPVACAKLMNDRMPNSTLHIFQEVGHLFPYEIPEETSQKALSFLT